jgi:hypothetical protein
MHHEATASRTNVLRIELAANVCGRTDLVSMSA